MVMAGGATAPEEIAFVNDFIVWLHRIGCNFLIYFPHCSLCPLHIGPWTFVEGEKPKFSGIPLSKRVVIQTQAAAWTDGFLFCTSPSQCFIFKMYFKTSLQFPNYHKNSHGKVMVSMPLF